MTWNGMDTRGLRFEDDLLSSFFFPYLFWSPRIVVSLIGPLRSLFFLFCSVRTHSCEMELAFFACMYVT